ncbi:MAG: DUF3263 domain-containing protein [Corynebacterium sp.]|uniref:DUF3263 domain-containing protein n=1 Tax=unclassified Corynebacterium TaxID=2624378 RepID=UPI00264948C8|nr:DUF3263 domain-containing protein [Corynebacterium sp.]
MEEQSADTGVGVSQREREMLDFESLWWRDEGAKGEEIRRRFGVTPVRYYQQLNALISRPEALDVAPVVVRTLLRRRGD